MKTIFAILLFAVASASAQIITVSVTVTNTPNGNTNTFTLNGSTRTFTNSVTSSPGTLIQQTNTPSATATQMVNHFTAYPFSSGQIPAMGNATNVTIRGLPGSAMSASLAGAWGVITYSTQSLATPTIVVRVPYSNEGATQRTNIASGIAEYLNLATNGIATNATALSNYIHKGAGAQQVVRTSLQVTQLNGMVSALTNGYFTNAILDKLRGTNGTFYGGLQSIGSGALSIQLGTNATASGLNSIAIGSDSIASGYNSIALGSASMATNQSGVAIGTSANALGVGSTAVGDGSIAGGFGSSAFGSAAEITGSNSVAIGAGANISADRAIAIGYQASVVSTSSIAIGYLSAAAYSNSVVIGNGVSATASNQVRLGTSLHTVSVPGRLNVEDALTNNIFAGTNIWRGDISYPPTTSTSASTTNVLATGTNVILRVTGTPGAAWTLAGISGPNRDGLFRIIYNDTGYTLTIGNEAGTASDASTRIRTMTGADVSTGTNSVCQFFYDGTRSRWIMISHNP